MESRSRPYSLMKVFLLVSLLIGLSRANIMGPVVNLSATYIPESNIVLVTWEDVDSVMMMTESNNTYEVFYDITVAGILLLTDSGEPEGDDLAGNFNFTISEEEFFQAGVSVNVTVMATDMMNMTYATSTTADIDGDFAPAVEDFKLVPLTTMLQPAVTLTWNDSFQEASPFQYQLTYNGTKLSGVSQDINTTLMLSSDDVTAMTGDNLYIVTELLFYTEYTFTLVADYNLTGQVFQSVGVVESLTTREGPPSAPQNVMLTFEPQFSSFDSSSQTLSTTANVSWAAPLEPNGIITGYNLTIAESDSGSVAFSGSAGGNATLSQPMVTVSAYVQYTASVVAFTAAGSSDATASDPQFSPQADPGPVLNAALSFDSVSNFAAGGNIDVSLVVSWTPPAVLNGIIVSQTVTIQSSDGVVVVTDSSVGVSATTLSLTSVTVNPNAGYFATIRVTNGGGFSETNTSTVTSPEGVPDEVRNISLVFDETSAIHNTSTQTLTVSVTVSWLLPLETRGVLQPYSVTIWNLQGMVAFQNPSVSSNATSLSLTVAQVSPSTEYFVNITATTSGGNITATSPASISPEAAPSPPTNIMITSITSTSALLRWSAPTFPNGIILLYSITLIAVDEASVMRLLNSTTDGVDILLDSLDPFTRYSVTLYASNSIMGEASEPTQFTTQEDAPSQVEMLTITEDIMSLIIAWEEPVSANGPGNITYTVTTTCVDLRTGDTLFSNMLVILSAVEPVSITRTPYTRCSATVTPQTDAGQGPSSSESIDVPEEAPSAVRNLTLSHNDSHFVVLWVEPVEPNGNLNYTISLTGTSLVTGMEVLSRTAEEVLGLEVVFMDDLGVYSQYTVVVVPRTGGGEGPGENASFTSPEQVPSAPRSFVLSMVPNSPRTLMASWMEPNPTNGIISNYTIRCNNTNTTMAREPQVITDVSALSATLDGLTPFTTYECTISASTGAGEGASSGPQSATTDEDVPSAPRNFTLATVGNSPRTLMASWMEPAPTNGIISNYIIKCNNTNSTMTREPQVITDVSALSVTLDGLTPFTTYECTISASTGAGEGASSCPQSATTDEDVPEAPVNLTATATAPESITVSWQAPEITNGRIINYMVNVTSGSGVISRNTTLDTTFMATTLSPFTNYTFAVSAVTSAGAGTSVEIVVATEQDAPSAPLAVVTEAASSTSVNVTWSPPSMPNGIIRRYQVTYTRNDVMDAAIQMTNTSGPDTMIQLSGLERFANYAITVQGFTVALGDTSDPVSVRTNEDVPSAPSIVSATSPVFSVIELVWTAPEMENGVIRGYQVTYYQTDLGTDNSTVLNTNSSDLEFSITGLQPFTNYSVSVAAITIAAGPASGVVEVRTNENVPSGLLMLTLEQNSSHIIANWTTPASPNGDIMYNLTLTSTSLLTDDITDIVAGVILTDTEFVLGVILEFFTMYEVSVVPFTGAGDGSGLTASFITEEGEPSVPTNVTINLTNSRLTVSWDPPLDPNGNVTYELNITLVDMATLNSTPLFGPVLREDSSRLFEMILAMEEPFARYEASVVAMTTGGRSQVVSVNTTTGEGEPSVPTNVAISLTNSRLTVSWDPPLDPNGIVTYELNITLVDMATLNSTPLFGPVLRDDSSRLFEMILAMEEPFARYEASVVAMTTGGRSQVVNVNTATGEGEPSIPTNVAISLTNSRLTVSWDPPLDPNGIVTYELNITLVDMATLNSTLLFGPVLSNDSSRLFEMLLAMEEPFARYQALVVAMTTGGRSQVVSVNTTTSEGVSEAVVGLMVDPTNTTVSVTWSSPVDANGVVSNYNASLTSAAENTTPQMEMVPASSGTLEVTFSGLRPFVNYTVSVRPFTNSGSISGDIAEVDFTTDIGIPSEPLSVAASPEGMGRTLVVTWAQPTYPNAPSLSYVVTYTAATTSGVEMAAMTQDLTSTITGLSPFTNYSIAVQACSEVGCGAQSREVIALTREEAPSAPLNFALSQVPMRPMELEARWTIPEESNGIILDYTVMCNGSDMITRSIAFNGSDIQLGSGENEISVTLVGLDPFTVYECSVSAATNGGVGNASETAVARTEQDVPSAPGGFVLSMVPASPRTLMASWMEPDPTNGIISNYTIRCTDTISNIVQVPQVITNVSVLSATLDGLTPFTTYECTISASTGAGEGASSGPQSATTDQDVPSAPRNFTLLMVENSPRTLMASWMEPAPTNGIISSYAIRCNNTNSTMTREPQVITDVSALSATLDGLMPFTTYECTISASTGAGEGASSGPQSAATAEDVPEAPANLTATATTPESITVSWQAPEITNGIIIKYMVNVTSGSGVISRNTTLDTTFTTTTLSPFTNYTFAVSAVTSAGAGTSFEIVVATEQDAPSAPLAVVAEAASSTSVNVTWSPPSMPNGIITHYQVTYTRNDVMDAANTSGPATMIQLSGLERFTNYTITVRGFTVDLGEASDPATVRTNEDVPSAPSIVSATSPVFSVIELVWTAPEMENGVIRRYQVTYYQTDLGTDSSTVLNTNSSDLEFNITGLQPFTDYSVSVAAITIAAGPTSGVVAVQTNESVPGPVINLMARDFNATSILVTFSPPSSPNGIITRYEISYMVTSAETSEPVAITEDLKRTTFEVTITELEPFTEYSVSVVAETRIGPGTPVDQIVTTDPTTSSPPTNVSAEAVSSDSISVTWSYPDTPRGDIEGYIIRYDLSSGMLGAGAMELNLTLSSRDDQSPQMETIGGLMPFTQYSITVRAYSFGEGVVHNGDESAVVTVRTLEAAPTVPRSFSLSPVTNNPGALQADWIIPERTNGIIQNYTIMCNNSDSGMFVIEGSEAEMISSMLVGNFDPFTVYECSVSAATNGGVGDASETAVARTEQDVPSAPINFMLAMVENSPHTLMASWMEPDPTNGIVSNYTIRCNDTISNIVRVPQVVTNVSALSATLDGLMPFTMYECTISASTGAGEGASSGPQSATTDEDVPGVPVGLTAVLPIGPESVTVSWQEPEMTNGNIIHYLVTVTSGSQLINEDEMTTDLSFSADELTPFTNYTFAVSAVTNAGEGLSVELTVITAQDAPSAPLAVVAEAASSTSVNVTWSPPSMPNGIIRRYEVNYTRNGATPQMMNTSGPATMIQLSGLEIFAIYTITVRGFTVAPGDASSQVTVMTNEDFPGPVTTLMARDLNATSILVTFSPPSSPNGIITRYNLSYMVTSAESSELIAITEDLDRTMFVVTITGLEPFTEYSVSVVAETRIGPGTAEVQTVTTDPTASSPPTNVNAVAVSSDTISITWSYPATPRGVIEGYIIQYYVTSDTLEASAMELNFTLSPRNNQSAQMATIIGLVPFTQYSITIRAYSFGEGVVHNGELSAVVMVCTLEAAPSAPRNFSLSPIADNPRELQADWTIPLDTNGVIQSYSVMCNNSEVFVVQGSEAEMISSTLDRNFEPFTVYECSVSAATDGGVGGASETAVARTEQDVPSVPRGFMLSMVPDFPRTLMASWMEPDPTNGIISNYTIRCNNSISNIVRVPQVITNLSALTATLDGLTPFTMYECTISASTGAGEGASSGPQSATTDEDVPGVPVGLTAMLPTGPESVTVSWQEPEMPNGNIIHYLVTVTSGSQLINEMTTDLSFFADELTPFTNYTFAVSAVTSAGEGMSVELTVITAQDAPSAPLDVMAEAASSTSVNVTWSPPSMPNGIITRYQVTYTRNDVMNAANTSGPATMIQLSGLEKFTNYTIAVRGFTDALGEESDPVSVRTNEDVPEDPPQGFTSTNTTSTSITLIWSPPTMPNGVITNYTLMMTDSETLLILPPSNFGYVAANLDEATSFTFSIAAQTSVGQGPEASITVTTLEDAPAGPPNNLAAIAFSPTTINVTWEEPDLADQNGVITSYTVTYRSLGAVDEGGRFDTSGTATTLENLEEFTQYEITVNASTAIGTGPGAITTNRTLGDEPGMKVTVESFVATSNTSVSVRWSALEEIHHNAETETIFYMIVLTNTNASEAQSINTSNLTMNIQGLVPFTVYRVKVAAVNSIGLGPFSDEVINQTFEGVPDPPRDLMTDISGFSTAMLSWTRPLMSYGIIVRYIITYQRMNEEEIPVTVGPAVTQHSLTDLRGNSVYMVMVQAETSAGRGEPIMAMFSTPSGPPPVVTSEPDIIPMLDDMETVTTMSFTVEFDIIEEQLVNGPVDKIRMFVQRKPSNNATITTYYESNLFKANFPQYAALDMAVQNTGRRKRQDDGGMTQTVMIGSDMNCGPTDDPCNGPLQPGAQYGVRYDLFSGDEVQSYPFFDTTFSTMPAPSATQSGVFAGAALAAIVILVLVVVLILVIVFIMYNRRKSGKADMSLLPADENKPQHKLQDLNHSIVPKEDGISTPAIINARFQLHHVQANTRKVYVRDFAQHLQGMLEDSGYKFSEEYERVTEIGLDHAKEGSLQAENRAKNRYTNILAYDHSRVKLSFIDDEPGSDYINASYIPGHRMRRAYVATQGPLPATFDDFWRMVWEQNTHIIVMLTQLVERGRTKCHRYWPGTEPIVYGDIAVEMLSEKDKEDWTIREFKLSLDEKRHRLVRHFQFTSWPDHGVPENPVTAVDFVKTVRCYIESIHGPIVVHCSAGVGRTGCFLALDTLMLHIKDHDWVDVFGLACEMRQHRNHMIQTEAQYVFIHKALLEILDAMATIKNGTIGSHYSQGSGYPTLFINRFAEESLTPMSDYYGEGLSEETHM